MAATKPLRLAVVLSGRGSNMAAVAKAAPHFGAEVVKVVADRETAGGLARAAELGLPHETVAAREFPDKPAFERALIESIDACAPDLVVLAGFMRILGGDIVRHFRGRMLNIHPSLLPKYKGLHTHRRALEAGDSKHGCSVHYVTEELDGGPVVLQARIAIRAGEDEAQLSARVQACEHIIYPRTIGWIAAGRLRWTAAGPEFDGRPLSTPFLEDGDDPQFA